MPMSPEWCKEQEDKRQAEMDAAWVRLTPEQKEAKQEAFAQMFSSSRRFKDLFGRSSPHSQF